MVRSACSLQVHLLHFLFFRMSKQKLFILNRLDLGKVALQGNMPHLKRWCTQSKPVKSEKANAKSKHCMLQIVALRY